MIPKYSCLQMSPSQIQLKLPRHCTLASPRPALATEWVWPYFVVTTVEREWIVKRTGKRRIVDRGILAVPMSTRRLVPSAIGKQQIRRGKLLTKKENITTQQRLEKNILRWVVTSKQPFTVVQDPDFKQIFQSLATVWQLTMSSRNSDPSCQLKDDLSTTCSTIALSLDATASLSSR